MSAIRLVSVGFGYSDAENILEAVNLHLARGWTGLVGSNGSGKTTLLRLLAGELEPTHGVVGMDPAHAALTLCRQRTEHAAHEVAGFAEAVDRSAVRLRERLGLRPAMFERWPSLSAGERKRWQVGAALWHEPDVMLLDEPTNHLDAAAVELLATELARYRGVGVVVSHDRALLDRLTATTVRLIAGAATTWRGPYSRAKQEWEAHGRERQRDYARAKDDRDRLQRRLGDTRRARAAASRNGSTKKRMKGPKDHDARSSATKGRVANAEARLSRSARTLGAAVERAQAKVGAFVFAPEKGGELFIDFEPCPKRELFVLDASRVCAGEHEVAHSVTVRVGRSDRIRIAGPNGAGKTTLLECLCAAARIDAEKILYLPQELAADEGRRLVHDTRGLNRATKGRVLALVAALGVDPARLLATDLPSPGEARELALAHGLGRRVWAAILDEPTNHLDLPSIERLQSALAAYPGTLILVTHDNPLAQATTSHTWTIADGRVLA